MTMSPIFPIEFAKPFMDGAFSIIRGQVLKPFSADAMDGFVCMVVVVFVVFPYLMCTQ